MKGSHTPDLDFQIIRSKRKTIALVIQPDGSLVVRAPLRAAQSAIETLVAQKADWIHKKQAQVKAASQIVRKRFVSGEDFLYLGKPYVLEVAAKSSRPLTLEGKFILDKKAHPKARQVFTQWYKEQARRIFSERVNWYAHRHGFAYQSIRISSARTRWGSCSPRGTLSFTWRLVMAPLPVIDYVVVHELVHTLERNHQKGFWEKVKAILPDYQQRRAWLKKNGGLLRFDAA